MSVMEQQQLPNRVRRSFTGEFKADAVSMRLTRWGLVMARWATGSVKPESTAASVRGSQLRRKPNSPGFVRRMPVCGWNEIYSNEQRPSG